jgi:large subunit ribosomal protein L6
MSRIGKLPIPIPAGVTITVDPDFITVTGVKGTLQQFTMPSIGVAVGGEQVVVTRVGDDEPQNRAKHGLMRSLVNNMIIGVSKGFSKELEIQGVGYRVSMQGTNLRFNLGFSHDVIYKLPQGVNAAIDQNKITISGISKQQVGQVTAEIRSLRKPEPYKGKGIRYTDERVLRKSGKSGKDK